MVYLNSNELSEIGTYLSDKIASHKLDKNAEFTIEVDEESFKKIDEDLFYRNNVDGKGEFTPSFSIITVKFPFVNIIIKKSQS